MKTGFYIIREEDGEMLEATRENFEIGMAESENLVELAAWLRYKAPRFTDLIITEHDGVYHAEFHPANN